MVSTQQPKGRALRVAKVAEQDAKRETGRVRCGLGCRVARGHAPVEERGIDLERRVLHAASEVFLDWPRLGIQGIRDRDKGGGRERRCVPR